MSLANVGVLSGAHFLHQRGISKSRPLLLAQCSTGTYHGRGLDRSGQGLLESHENVSRWAVFDALGQGSEALYERFAGFSPMNVSYSRVTLLSELGIGGRRPHVDILASAHFDLMSCRTIRVVPAQRNWRGSQPTNLFPALYLTSGKQETDKSRSNRSQNATLRLDSPNPNLNV